MKITMDNGSAIDSSALKNSIGHRELKSKDEPSFSFSLRATLENTKGTKPLNTREADNRVVFYKNLDYWNNEVAFMSTNNFDNSYFGRIVEMGKEAVPFILEELKKHPSPLVHALDLIFPDVVEYDGYVSLEDACRTWISILTPTERN